MMHASCLMLYNVVAISSSQCVNRGPACIVVNRDYFEYYMSVYVVWQVTVLRLFQGIIHNYTELNNYAHLQWRIQGGGARGPGPPPLEMLKV